MDLIDSSYIGRTYSLYSYPVRSTNLIKDNSSNILRELIRRNVTNLESEVFCLKLKNPDAMPIIAQMKVMVFSIIHVLSNPNVYFNAVKISLAFAGIFSVCALAFFAVLVVPITIACMGILFYPYESMQIMALIWYTGLFSVFESVVRAISNTSRQLYFYFADMLEDGLASLELVYDRFKTESSQMRKDYTLLRQNASCFEIEPEAILNAHAYGANFLDPVTQQYFNLNLNSSALMRLGRYVMPLRSVIELIIKSGASQIQEVLHPVHQNRYLSSDEIEQLKIDFSNFFSCDLKIMEEILAVKIPIDQQDQFRDPIAVLQYVKASIFSKYVAQELPSFSPKQITRFDFLDQMPFYEQQQIQTVLKIIQDKFFINR